MFLIYIVIYRQSINRSINRFTVKEWVVQINQSINYRNFITIDCFFRCAIPEWHFSPPSHSSSTPLAPWSDHCFSAFSPTSLAGKRPFSLWSRCSSCPAWPPPRPAASSPSACIASSTASPLSPCGLSLWLWGWNWWVHRCELRSGRRCSCPTR